MLSIVKKAFSIGTCFCLLTLLSFGFSFSMYFDSYKAEIEEIEVEYLDFYIFSNDVSDLYEEIKSNDLLSSAEKDILFGTLFKKLKNEFLEHIEDSYIGKYCNQDDYYELESLLDDTTYNNEEKIELVFSHFTKKGLKDNLVSRLIGELDVEENGLSGFSQEEIIDYLEGLTKDQITILIKKSGLSSDEIKTLLQNLSEQYGVPVQEVIKEIVKEVEVEKVVEKEKIVYREKSIQQIITDSKYFNLPSTLLAAYLPTVAAKSIFAQNKTMVNIATYATITVATVGIMTLLYKKIKAKKNICFNCLHEL